MVCLTTTVTELPPYVQLFIVK